MRRRGACQGAWIPYRCVHALSLKRRRPPSVRSTASHALERASDRAADLAEDRADLLAQEDEGDNRDDRDEGKDQRVLGETLAFLIPAKGSDESSEPRQCGILSGNGGFPGSAASTLRSGTSRCQGLIDVQWCTRATP
jgi:hypothetical protein